ncbi:MAG: hypothetical protein JNL03_06460 [Prolixibacteraceae bacterium]|nr:hypothetical protein [Prolixibacteraceae bacterium]
MKATSKTNPEKVLWKNSMYMTTDGQGVMLIHSEEGKKATKIKSVLSELGVEFSFEKYSEEMVCVEDYTDPEIGDEALDVGRMKMIKFKVKIEDLKDDCPSLYSWLIEKNRIDQIVRQYLTDNNLLNRYVLN